jgi:hypothetical protein
VQAVVPARAVGIEPHVVDALLLGLVGGGRAVEVRAELVDTGERAAEQGQAGKEGGDRDRVRHRSYGITCASSRPKSRLRVSCVGCLTKRRML